MIHFPQPTRPIGSSDAASDSFFPDNSLLQQPFYSEHQQVVQQQQQPSESTIFANSYQDMYAQPFVAEKQLPQELLNFQFYSNETEPKPSTSEEEEKEEREIVEELIKVMAEWYKKLPNSIRKRLNLKTLNDSVTLQKGSARDLQVSDLSQKLERFKVRTFGQGETVKDDQDDNGK